MRSTAPATPSSTGLKVSIVGGASPRRSADGSELFYADGDRLMAVTVTTAPSVTAGTPEELFRLDDTLVLSDAARSLAAEVESLTPMAEVAAIQPTQEIHDVVVVGSGAGGGTVAHVLTGLGLRVTLLEAGPMLDPMRDFKEHQWPHDYDHRGAEVGGRRYFGRGEAFGFFSTTSGG